MYLWSSACVRSSSVSLENIYKHINRQKITRKQTKDLIIDLYKYNQNLQWGKNNNTRTREIVNKLTYRLLPCIQLTWIWSCIPQGPLILSRVIPEQSTRSKPWPVLNAALKQTKQKGRLFQQRVIEELDAQDQRKKVSRHTPYSFHNN